MSDFNFTSLFLINKALELSFTCGGGFVIVVHGDGGCIAIVVFWG